jgi:hypothetical protein
MKKTEFSVLKMHYNVAFKKQQVSVNRRMGTKNRQRSIKISL